jgi:hypothetical protein
VARRLEKRTGASGAARDMTLPFMFLRRFVVKRIGI